MLKLWLLLSVSALSALAGQAPISYEAFVDPALPSTPPPPPRPYVFSYTAGRFAGHADRTHTEVSDGSGVVKDMCAAPARRRRRRHDSSARSGRAQVNQSACEFSLSIYLPSRRLPPRQGTFSYVDPRNVVRTVDYTADKEGFHPILSHPQALLPVDSEAVAKAKEKHLSLFARIAEQHATNPHPGVAPAILPVQSAAVAKATDRHYELFGRIAEQHHQIAAQREAERLAFEAASERNINELHEY